jgi:type VI secretion system protein ImpA
MALTENSQLPELLAPIPGDDPVGPDLKWSNEFSEIERTFSQGQDAIPATKPPGFPGGDAEEHFGRLMDLAWEFLETQSKDLRVASYLTAALLRMGMGPEDDPFPARCFAGLSFGLELLQGLMETYWDTLYPGIPSRAAALDALGTGGLPIAVRMVPLTEWGHTYFHHRDWAKGGKLDKGPPDPDTLWAGNFQAGFDETDRDFYLALDREVKGSLERLEALEGFCKERFSAAGETPPRFGDLRQALQNMVSATEDLLEKKPAPASQAPPAPESAPGEGGPVAVEASGEASTVQEAPVGQATPAAAPSVAPQEAPAPARPASSAGVDLRDPRQAPAAVAAAARVLREEDPRNPVSYLLLRGLRWGELRSGGDRIDPKLLEAPEPEDRRRLRSLFLEEEWVQILAVSEEVMATEAGRGWLDLQRYAILAADKLGPEYRQVAMALRGALKSALTDLPGLVTATLMDDSAAASPDTRTWLETSGFVRTDDGHGDGDDLADDTDPERLRREASFERARQMVQAGDADGAIRLLMARARGEKSERARFMARVEAVGIMVERGDGQVARPILDEIMKEIQEHNLEEWEAGEAVARPLGLLYRCLAQGEDAIRQQTYQRICRLDPLLARSMGETERGD